MKKNLFLLGNYAILFRLNCHAELVSASLSFIKKILKRVQDNNNLRMLCLLLLLVTVSFASPKSVYGQEIDSGEENSATDSASEINVIPSLILNPVLDGPSEKLIPLPTPEPQKENESSKKYQDKRSWTKFKYNELIFKVSKLYNLDPQLIYATIMTESEGDEYAYRYEPSIDDASLCMGQILIGTARNLGFSGDAFDLYKPEICIDLIGKYHRNMLDTFGDLTPLQLATAYNAGSPWKWPVAGHLFRFDSWYNEMTGG